MRAQTGRFTRADRMRRSWEYRRVAKVGRRFTTESFVLLVAAGGQLGADARGRLGVTVSRRVGGAVLRNQVKRRVREWYRRERDRLWEAGAGDVVVIARRPAAGLAAGEVDRVLTGLAERVREEGA